MTGKPTLGIISPGAMGSALGRAWVASGLRVVATTKGRSPRTAALAHGLELVPGLDAVIDAADIVMSVCPPAAAPALARDIADTAARLGRRPLVVDLNAVAPATVRTVARTLAGEGLELVDGSISGGPPTGRGMPTRLYLSGPGAARVAALEAPGITLTVVSDRIGDASAVKMCTAAVYKGFSALLAQALATARANGVDGLVLADLRGTFGERMDRVATQIAVAASKADRYPGEMREIARAQRDAGVVGELFEGMAIAYEHIHATALGRHTPEDAAGLRDLDAVLAELAQPSPASTPA